MEEKNKYPRGRGFAIGLAMGIPLGMVIGLAMNNLALGPAIGVAIGAGLGAALERSYNKREEMETPETSRKKTMTLLTITGLLTAGIIALLCIYFLIRKHF